MNIGFEIPSLDLAASLDDDLAGFAAALDAGGATYAIVGADRAEEGTAPSQNPTVIGALLARRTQSIGLVVAGSPQRDHPYNLARRLSSLDHVSSGRAGLLALRRDRAVGLGLGGGSSWVEAAIGAGELADAVTAMRKLWRTWPIETLASDPAAAAATVIRTANHTGIFSTKGPLNSPTTRQGEPLVFWRWSGEEGFDTEFAAARSADIVIVDAAEIDAFLAAAQGALGAAAAAGEPVQIHLRVRAADLSDPAVSGWRTHPAIAGLTLVPKPDGLAALLAAPQASAPGRTLRERLAVPRRDAPDLSGNPAIYVPDNKASA